MSNIIIAFLGLLASMAAFTDLPEQMKKVFGDSILLGQQIATAGDLRSMSEMLDVNYITRGRYPAEDEFDKWLADTFKGSNLKSLTEDHWGHKYLYTAAQNGKSYELRSVGVDAIAGSNDDMTMSEP